MEWKSLISTQNLKLAWRRINTGTNLQYKRFFRPSYLVYESALDEHIKQLHKDLKAKAWEPTYATRLYIPKPSGLQRPLSLLGIEDQILLQAIANLFAKKLHKKRQGVELKTVFSNKLLAQKGSIFFVEHWQTTYHAFQEKCIEVFNNEYKWSAHFDLSAFYDTISHDLLLKVESQVGAETRDIARDIAKKWLRKWSAENKGTMKDHGIPQGPVASNFLAEAFFLPIDISLQKQPFQYLRYVDDIRLFGRTENEVREATILLEQKCHERGLIPQGKKFEIREMKSVADAMGALPSIPPRANRNSAESFITAKKARSILTPAIGGRPQKVKDKTRFRYVMYRAPKDTELLKTVLRLLPRHPEHIDAFIAYFNNFERRRTIARVALDYLETGVPYSYVRGELWHVIARLAGPEELRRGLPIARKDAGNKSHCMALSWGVRHFLMKCEGPARTSKRFAKEHYSISRSLLAPIILSNQEFRLSDQEFKKHAVTLLKGNLMEQLAGARVLQSREVTLNALQLRQRNLPGHCKIALRSLGVIRRHHKAEKDYIKDILVERYGCQHSSIWHKLLGEEYEHALQILIEAKAHFESARSEWLMSQDSFNNLVVCQFFDFLKQKGLNGHSKTEDRRGNRVNYGSLIAVRTPFDITYPSEAEVFRILHERRNTLPSSHPYDHKGGEKNKWLNKKERDKLVPKLKNALDGIANIFASN